MTELLKDNIQLSQPEKVLLNELLNFIEVYIHTILYLRNVYPRGAFTNYEIYNLKLKYLADNDVWIYITEVLISLK
jgi:hypothetical protein